MGLGAEPFVPRADAPFTGGGIHLCPGSTGSGGLQLAVAWGASYHARADHGAPGGSWGPSGPVSGAEGAKGVPDVENPAPQGTIGRKSGTWAAGTTV
jgi:hypothetical protein